MNHRCPYSIDGMHRFFMTVAPPELSKETTSLKPSTFHTCMACGHRRAIDHIGYLWYWSSTDWVMVIEGSQTPQNEVNSNGDKTE